MRFSLADYASSPFMLILQVIMPVNRIHDYQMQRLTSGKKGQSSSSDDKLTSQHEMLYVDITEL